MEPIRVHSISVYSSPSCSDVFFVHILLHHSFLMVFGMYSNIHFVDVRYRYKCQYFVRVSTWILKRPRQTPIRNAGKSVAASDKALGQEPSYWTELFFGSPHRSMAEPRDLGPCTPLRSLCEFAETSAVSPAVRMFTQNGNKGAAGSAPTIWLFKGLSEISFSN